jgi:hypothetical protein
MDIICLYSIACIEKFIYRPDIRKGKSAKVVDRVSIQPFIGSDYFFIRVL